MLFPSFAGTAPARTLLSRIQQTSPPYNPIRAAFRPAWMLLALFLLPSARPLPVAPTQSAVVPMVVSCNLPAPAYCTAERTGPSTASVTWGNVQGADAYQMRVYEQGSDQLVYSATVHGTSTSLGGLQSGQTYYCTVAAMCPGGSASDFVIIEEIVD